MPDLTSQSGRATSSQTSFAAGEMSPRGLARSDLQKYSQACTTLENLVVMKLGGAMRRTGTKFVQSTKANGQARLVEFAFNDQKNYLLEFGAGYIRVFNPRPTGAVDSRHIVEIDTSPAATAGTVPVAGATALTVKVDITDHGYRAGDSFVASGGTDASWDGNHTVTKIHSDDQFEYAIAGGVSTTGSVNILTSEDYLATELNNLKFTQSADILYIFHKDHPPMEFRRIGATDTSVSDWQFRPMTFQDGPYLALNLSQTTLTATALTGYTTITSNNDIFVAADVGRLIRLSDGTRWGWGRINVVTDAKNIKVTVLDDFPTITATANWQLGAWGGIAVADSPGYPSCGTFHQNRLWLAGTIFEPQTVFASESGNFIGHAPSTLDEGVVADDHAIVSTISDDKVNAIRYIKSMSKGLVCLTEGGQFVVQAGGEFDPFTPSTTAFARQSTVGSSEAAPVVVGNSMLFAQAGGRKIRELQFRFPEDQFVDPDMTLISEHITRSGSTDHLGIIDTAFTTEPTETLWAILDDGQLLSMTYAREEDVVAWSKHPMSGTGISVESIAVSRNTDGNDDLWMIVKRDIGGVSKRYIEYIGGAFELGLGEGDLSDAEFSDSNVKYDSTPTTTITGLSHLEGELVSVFADGKVQANKTVTSGQITITSASTVIVGLPYTSTLIPMPILPAGHTDPRGRPTRVYRAIVFLHETLGGKIGPDATELIEIDSRPDSSKALFTGNVERRINETYTRTPQISIVQDKPAPMTILAIVYDAEVGSE